jgi:spermidine synthase
MVLFAFTLFVSAALLFTVQLMFARMVLPLLGGAPSVWNTCMVFFQATLLLGYVYADMIASRVKPRRMAPFHLLLLLAMAAFLPVGLKAGLQPPAQSNPIPWLLGLMAMTVGPPFLAVSTSSSVLQKWFSTTRHSAARDPYFLYAASNLGSFFGLAGYILLVEPNLTLREQSRWWAAGYALLLLLTAACALYAVRQERRDDVAPDVSAADHPAPRKSAQARWVLLAAIPSSLMLGITTFISTDIASVPLLWALPLGLYLLTFIMAFARTRLVPQRLLVAVMPLLMSWLILTLTIGRVELKWLLTVHLGVFFALSLALHQRLADERPPARRLTRFYLFVALGGVLGGAFNSLLAPVLFRSVVEYRITLVAACLLLPAYPLNIRLRRGEARPAEGSVARLLATYALLPLFIWLVMTYAPTVFKRLALPPTSPVVWIAMAAVMLLSATFVLKPYLYGLGVAAMLLGLALNPLKRDNTLYAERTFFGVVRVLHNARKSRVELMHGTTLHGAQSLIKGREDAATTYYHPTGPVGQTILAMMQEKRLRDVGVIGLGAGTLASYARPGQTYTYYEIDPAVVRVATSPELNAFTFVTRARERGARVNIIVGDARLRLADAPNNAYDLIVVDAFSSDSIPVHLVSREALRLYLDKLRPDGIIAFHVSNRYLNLSPIIIRLAHDAGVSWRSQADNARLAPVPGKAWDKEISRWVIVARTDRAFGALGRDIRWTKPDPDPTRRVWTDDYASILDALRK